MQGSTVWLLPLLLQDDLQNLRQQASLERRPVNEQQIMSLHTQLRIQGLPHVEHPMLCEDLMNKISQVIQIPLNKATGITPGANEWVVCYLTGGEFAQKIALQLENEEALKNSFCMCMALASASVDGTSWWRYAPYILNSKQSQLTISFLLHRVFLPTSVVGGRVLSQQCVKM